MKKDQDEMKNFNDYLMSDLRVFVNPDEMGEKALVDGKEMDVTITHNSIDDRKRLVAREYDIDPQGVYHATMAMYVRFSDLGFVPVERQMMNINGREFIVIGAGEEKGMVTVRFERNGS